MINRVYFLGAGPGDPGLLTRRSECILRQCRVAYVPPLYENAFSELLNDKDLFVPFDYYFDDLVRKIREQLQSGSVAFLVPGDLTFYSPFQALVDELDGLAEVVPGVGTVNAASALLKKTLDLPGVCSQTVLFSPRTLGAIPGSPTIKDVAVPGTTLVIYMNNQPLELLKSQLREGYGKDVPIALVHKVGLPEQEMILATLDTILEKVGTKDYFNLQSANSRPALTLVIVGESITATADRNWWDYRRDHIWKKKEE